MQRYFSIWKISEQSAKSKKKHHTSFHYLLCVRPLKRPKAEVWSLRGTSDTWARSSVWATSWFDCDQSRTSRLWDQAKTFTSSPLTCDPFDSPPLANSVIDQSLDAFLAIPLVLIPEFRVRAEVMDIEQFFNEHVPGKQRSTRVVWTFGCHAVPQSVVLAVL